MREQREGVWVLRSRRGRIVGSSARDLYYAFQDHLHTISQIKERAKYGCVLEAQMDALYDKPCRHGYSIEFVPLSPPMDDADLETAAREYHKRVTACDDVWDQLDASEREIWYDDARAVLRAAIRNASKGEVK